MPLGRFGLVLCCALATLSGQQLPKLSKVHPGPEQPLPFSHKAHSARGIECQVCHPTPDPGDFAEIVGAAVCMDCHRASGAASDAVTKLAEFEKNGEEIWWEPIYLVPEYVFFSHRAHASAGAKCVDCHGDVASADVMAKTHDTSMAACMSCHRATNASVECDFCHEPRGAAP